jgi:hypothetical protein
VKEIVAGGKAGHEGRFASVQDRRQRAPLPLRFVKRASPRPEPSLGEIGRRQIAAPVLQGIAGGYLMPPLIHKFDELTPEKRPQDAQLRGLLSKTSARPPAAIRKEEKYGKAKRDLTSCYPS